MRLRSQHLSHGGVSIFQPRTLNGHLVTLPRSVVSRLNLLKVVRGQALPLDEELHALVLVLPAIEIDVSLFHFLFPQSGGRFLRQGFRGLLLGICRVQRVAVVRGLEFRQQLSPADMLPLFHQDPGHFA